MNTALGTFRLFGFYRILFKEKNGRKVNGRAEKYAAGPDEGSDFPASSSQLYGSHNSVRFSGTVVVGDDRNGSVV